jgi:deferrochelatase/peroxidase EfeB
MQDQLDRSDVQGIILAAYKYPIARHFFFKFASNEGGRAFLAKLLPMVTNAAHLQLQTEPLLNLGLSWTGLLALRAFNDKGGPQLAEKEFYIFNEIPDPESLRLSPGQGPSRWWNGNFGTGDIHATVHVHTLTENALEDCTARIREAADSAGVQELKPTADQTAITGKVIRGQQINFGYKDGISNPDVNWDNEPNRPDLYPRGHFLLGEPTEDMQTFPDKPPLSDFVRHGSYMALVWMYQDVARFNQFLREEGPKLAPDGLPSQEAEEWLAAKMMGRWRDGTPLALSPDRMDSHLASDNAFGYSDDPMGIKCPFAAHIRVANGRDQPLKARFSGMFKSGFPRVLRRGTPYGPALEGMDDDRQDRGIVGQFLCANLNKQFYSLTRWLGQTNFSDVFSEVNGQDPIVGDRSFPGASTGFSIPTVGGPKLVQTLPNFVRVQGVAFLLLPSLTALRNLC